MENLATNWSLKLTILISLLGIDWLYVWIIRRLSSSSSYFLTWVIRWFGNCLIVSSTGCRFQQNMAAYQNMITQSMYDKQLDSGKGTLLHLCDDVIQQEVSIELDEIFRTIKYVLVHISLVIINCFYWWNCFIDEYLYTKVLYSFIGFMQFDLFVNSSSKSLTVWQAIQIFVRDLTW